MRAGVPRGQESQPLLIPLVAILLAAVAGAGTPDSASTVRRDAALMGSSCTIVAEAADTAATAAGVSLALAEVARLESVLSSWRPDSEVSLLNTHGLGAWFTCSPDLFAAIDSALAYAERTGGAFDPTIEALNRAWDLRGKGRVPKPRNLERARMNVGWQHASLDAQRHRVLFHHSDGGIDLGGIARGYALDRAGATLRGGGTARALLDFGSDVLAIGAWRVGVPDPADRSHSSVGLVVRDAAVARASASERFVTVKQKRYGHVLDPRTGRPVESDASVTVVAHSATGASALAIGFLVMGRDAAAAFVARRPDVGLLWLEPAEGGVRAWKWNLGTVESEPGAAVEWMN